MISFNGEKKIINVSNEYKVEITDIYSAWKRWVLKDDNAKYLQAFYVINSESTLYTLINKWTIHGIDKKNIEGRFI
jgi:hypothetical protein